MQEIVHRNRRSNEHIFFCNAHYTPLTANNFLPLASKSLASNSKALFPILTTPRYHVKIMYIPAQILTANIINQKTTMR